MPPNRDKVYNQISNLVKQEFSDVVIGSIRVKESYISDEPEEAIREFLRFVRERIKRKRTGEN